MIGSRQATRRSVALVTERGERRALPAAYLDAGHLEHAYALTCHAMQGSTVRQGFILAPDGGALAEWGYVACSRARMGSQLYLAVDTADAARAPDADRIVRALARSASETLAQDVRQPVATRPAVRSPELGHCLEL